MFKGSSVDEYVEAAELWPDEVAELRRILLDAGLDEELKWGKPCYGKDGNNLAIMQEMKDFLALMFFKGALLEDPAGELRAQGPNSRSAKRLEFTSVDDVSGSAESILGFVRAAIDVEEAGLEVPPAPEPDLVDELVERFDAQPGLRDAFESLTPGRRREYNLHFSSAKKAETRRARIDKCVPKILAGKGFRDR